MVRVPQAQEIKEPLQRDFKAEKIQMVREKKWYQMGEALERLRAGSI